jgi:hypothetical protein
MAAWCQQGRSMKKLVAIGALLAAFAIAGWLLRSPPAGDAGTAKSPEIAAPLPPPADRRESAEPVPAAEPVEHVALAPARESARAPGARSAPTQEQPSRPPAESRLDETKQLAECRALRERQHKAEQAARAAETKDPAWAYATEQKLREYLSRRLRTTPIEVTGIDCRATFCEIRGQGFLPASDEFRLAVAGVHQESWSDFTWSSGGFPNVQAGKVVYSGEVRRKQSYATAFEEQEDSPERSACTKLAGRRNQQERAARDAQPRDLGWADQMEQLLRMHLAAQLIKHAVELDISCRTTLCRIKAKGQSNDALLALQRTMTTIDSEPWANLRNDAGGITGYGDRWTADYTLHRR